MNRTHKRTAAIGLGFFMCFIAYQASKVDAIETLRIIIYPFFLLIGAGFGADWISKQTNLVGGLQQKDEP